MTIKGTIRASQLKTPTRLTYYEVLGLHRGSTMDEVAEAWRTLSRLMHPDVHHAKQSEDDRALQTHAFRYLSEAFSVLIDRKLRRLYERLIDISGEVCPDCSGAGRTIKILGLNKHAPSKQQVIVCLKCQGSGRRKRPGMQDPELMRVGGK